MKELRYKVVFKFRNECGDYVTADLSNNDEGFTSFDAYDVKRELEMQGNVNVRIVEMERREYV